MKNYDVLNDIVHLYLSKISLDLNTMLRTNFKTIKTAPLVKKLSNFYQDMLIGFNKCKTLNPISDLKPHEILSPVIWGNEFFQNKHKTLYFRNWVESGFLYVKDLLDEEGNWLTSELVIHRLSRTNNWIIEFSTLKKVLNKILKKLM